MPIRPFHTYYCYLYYIRIFKITAENKVNKDLFVILLGFIVASMVL